MGFTWDGTDEQLIRNMDAYADAVLRAVRKVAEYFAPIIEAHAKEHAPWTDRTANARQSLHSFVEELAQDVVALYLSHGMEYGYWLEVKNPEQAVNLPGVEVEMAGRYAIILPTLEEHYEPIMKMLQDIFK